MSHLKHFPLLSTRLPILLAECEETLQCESSSLGLSWNQALLRCLQLNGTAEKVDHVPPKATSNNLKGQNLRAMLRELGPGLAFNYGQWVSQYWTELCHSKESHFCISALIEAAFREVLA